MHWSHSLTKAPTNINTSDDRDRLFLNQLYFWSTDVSPNRLHNCKYLGGNKHFSARTQTKNNTPFPLSPAPCTPKRCAQGVGAPTRRGGCPVPPGKPAGRRVAAGVPREPPPPLPPPRSPWPARAAETCRARPPARRPLPRALSPALPFPRGSPNSAAPESTWGAVSRLGAPPAPPQRGFPPRPGRRASASPAPPCGGAEPRFPARQPLTSSPAWRSLRFRRALTSDSGCVRRPHRPRELPPPRAPRPRPQAGPRPRPGRAAPSGRRRARPSWACGLAEASWSRARETIELPSFGGSSRGISSTTWQRYAPRVCFVMDVCLSPETLSWQAVVLPKNRRELWINP